MKSEVLSSVQTVVFLSDFWIFLDIASLIGYLVHEAILSKGPKAVRICDVDLG